LQSRIEEIREAGAEVVAVSVDPLETNAELATSLGLTVPLVSDPDLTAIDAFGVRHDVGAGDDVQSIARPAVFVIDPEGRIVWRRLTDDWRVRVRPEQVLEVLRRPGAGG
jgi:peroxiredoxin